MKKRISMQRTFKAAMDLVWELWTTKEGIESWWGPPGFDVIVNRIELRVGGALEYVMTATGPEQIAFMKQANQPLSMTLKARYTLVEPKRRASWMNLADFIPGVEPYEVETRLTLVGVDRQTTRVELDFDAMHDDFYTSMAQQGWEAELGKLDAVIQKRSDA